MTETMNFFQSIFTFKSLRPAQLSRAELELAESLYSEAQELAGKAAEEIENGRTTKALAIEAIDPEKRRIFAGITVWHNQRAAEKYRKAAERFAEAGKIQRTKRKSLNSTAKKMMRGALEAIEAVKLMNDFLIQK
jgi:hypothetical protein